MKLNPVHLLFFLCTPFLCWSQDKLNKALNEPAWDIQLETSWPIHKVAAFKSFIWASDYGDGTIYKSSNYGDSFEKLATLGSEVFEQIQFIDAKTGFICGDYGYVYKTLDGGNSWIEISPPVEGRIKERYRGDSTKNQKPDGAYVAYHTMYFASATKGYVSGYQYNPEEGRGTFETLFFTTEDAGVNWQLLDKEGKETAINAFKMKPYKRHIIIDNEYFITDRTSYKIDRNKENLDVVIKTHNGRKTSDTIVLPKTPYEQVMLRTISFITDQTGFIVGGSFEEDHENAVIYQTTDSGKTWNYIPSTLAHIHTAIAHDNDLFLFGEYKLAKRIPGAAILPNGRIVRDKD